MANIPNERTCKSWSVAISRLHFESFLQLASLFSGVHLQFWLPLVLVSLLYCAGCAAGSNNAAKLAQDFIKTGFIPGVSAPNNIRMETNSLAYSNVPGQSFYRVANGNLHFDGDRNLVSAEFTAPDSGNQALTTVTITTWKNTQLFGLSQDQAVRIYGSPSEKVESTGPQGPDLRFNYYYSRASKPMICIQLIFSNAGVNANGAVYSSIRSLYESEATDVRTKKLRVYEWPQDL